MWKRLDASSSAMPSQHSGIDFVAYGRDGRVLLLAEAKSRRGASESWATGLRRNMLSHGVLPWSKYFLIATPERMYLWKQDQPNSADLPPEFTIDASEVFQPYFLKLHLEPSKIAPEAFDLLVLTWLTDIARSGRNQPQDNSPAWLPEFSGSLHQARIEMNSVQ
jgi:hypothetical protein